MLFQDFISQFPPSNTGEFTEKKGDILKVTWKMYQEISLKDASTTTDKNLSHFTKTLPTKLVTQRLLKRKKLSQSKLIPTHAQLEIDLKALTITFSYYTEKKSLKVGKAIIDNNEEVQFVDHDSQKLLPSFLEKVDYWFQDIKKQSS